MKTTATAQTPGNREGTAHPKQGATRFTLQEREILYHCAKMALADADVFDELAFALDLSDGEMLRIRDKLHAYLTEDRA